MRKILLAGLTAVVVALMFAVPEVRGIATWKIVLAALGLALFVLAERAHPHS
jgi:hypothetical protein